MIPGKSNFVPELNAPATRLAMLLQEGEDNPLVRELWSEIPKEKEKEEFLDNIQIDVSRILPPIGVITPPLVLSLHHLAAKT
jgi:hypothetical protein